MNNQEYTTAFEDYIISLILVQENLVINLTDNKQGRKFAVTYTMQNIPDRIKNTYGNLRIFYKQFKFVLNANNKDRIKIKNNGQIVFGVEITIAGEKIINQQVLRTQEQIVEVDNEQLVRYIQSFQAEKYQKNKQIEELNIKIISLQTQLNQKHSTQINEIQELKRRLEVLQGNQVHQIFESNQKLMQRIILLQNQLSQMQQDYKNCIKKSKKKDVQQKNLMVERISNFEEEQFTDMGAEEEYIDGFYCTFQLKNHILKIRLLQKATAEQFTIDIDELASRQLLIKNPEAIFRQIAYILRNSSQRQRIKITNQAVLIIKFNSEIEGQRDQIIVKIKAQKVQINQVQKAWRQIQIARKQISQSETLSHKFTQQSIKQLKDWTANELKSHQTNQQKYVQKLILEMNKDLQKTKRQLLGCEQSQRMGPHKKLTLKELQSDLKYLNSQLANLGGKFTQQTDQMKVQYISLSDKIISPKLFRLDLKISNILQNQTLCQTLFNILGPKAIQIRQLFKASEHNFSAKKFHHLCDFIPDTVVLVKTQFNKIIGGYTPLQWNWDRHGNYDSDPTLKGFVFSLTTGDKFTDSNTGNSIYNHQSYGPTFGGGHDLRIYDRADKNNSSYGGICHTYKNTNYTYNTKQAWSQFSGAQQNYNFKVLQYQVYKVIFSNN